MPGAGGQLKALWKQIIGGVAPSGAAASTGDVSQMVKWLVANAPSSPPVPVMMGPSDPNLSIGFEGVNSYTWFASNRAFFVPFQLTQSITVVKMFIQNGAAVSGNFDIGIYDEAFVRKVSSGSTAHAGVNIAQEIDVADTVLTAGRYYWALCFDNTTATLMMSNATTSERLKTRGCFQQALGAVTLPANATPASLTSTSVAVPDFGHSIRTLVA